MVDWTTDLRLWVWTTTKTRSWEKLRKLLTVSPGRKELSGVYRHESQQGKANQPINLSINQIIKQSWFDYFKILTRISGTFNCSLSQEIAWNSVIKYITSHWHNYCCWIKVDKAKAWYGRRSFSSVALFVLYFDEIYTRKGEQITPGVSMFKIDKTLRN